MAATQHLHLGTPFKVVNNFFWIAHAWQEVLRLDITRYFRHDSLQSTSADSFRAPGEPHNEQEEDAKCQLVRDLVNDVRSGFMEADLCYLMMISCHLPHCMII